MKLRLLTLSLLIFTKITPTPAVEATPNNAGKLVSFFLRDVIGGMVGLKASQGNPQEAASSLKQLLNGMAGIVETALEEQQTRSISMSKEMLEKIMGYLKIIIAESLHTPQGQEAFDLFLQELNSLEGSSK